MGLLLVPCLGNPGAASTNTALPALDWMPPDDAFDWIQLKSGEWLKGRIKAMQDESLEFDSKELDDLSFDWKDIRQLRSAQHLDVLLKKTGQERMFDALLEKGESLSGRVIATPDELRVEGETTLSVPRSRVQSLTPGGSKEWDLWSGNASLGLTLRGGNSEQVDYTGQARLQRRTPASRLRFSYIGNISSVDGVENTDNHRVNGEFDVWLSDHLYLILPSAEYYYDPFQNLDYRTTAGVGLGYDIVKRRKVEWSITTGPAYQWAKFASTQPGEPGKSESGALVFSSRFEWDITRRIEVIQEYRGQYTSKEVGSTTHHSVSTLSLELTDRFDLDVSFIWDRISRPKADANGVVPRPDDYRLVVGLSLDF